MFKEVFQLFNFLNKQLKKKVVLFFFFLIIASLLELLSIGIIFPSLNYLVNSENKSFDFIFSYFLSNESLTTKNKLLIFLAIYFTIVSSKTFFMIFFTWWRNNLVYYIENNLSINLYRNYLHLNIARFKEVNSSELTKNIIMEIKKARLIIDICLKSLIEIISIILITIILLYYQPLATLIVLGFVLVILFLFLLIFKKKLFQFGKGDITFTGKIFKSLQDGLNSIKSISIHGNQNYFVNSFAKLNEKRVNILRDMTTINENIRNAIEFLAILLLVFIILILLKYDDNIQNLIPSLTLFGAALYRLMPATNRLINYINAFESSKPAIQLLNKHFNRKEKNDQIKSKSKLHFKKNIICKNISHSYSKTEKVINNLSFKIDKNDFIAISGASGIGKSTLLDLICGIRKPYKGKIILDNKFDIHLNVNDWKKNIGYVPQSSYILDSDIKENIIFGNERFNKEKLIDAITFSNLKIFLNKKKEGINFKVGEDGCNLSGGQAQRLSIARAIYRSPEILICDEITNSLDKKNEKKIIDSLMKLRGKMTIICITHNLDIFKSKFVSKYEFVNKNNKSQLVKRI